MRWGTYMSTLHVGLPLIAQLVNLPAMQSLSSWFLGWEDQLEKEG